MQLKKTATINQACNIPKLIFPIKNHEIKKKTIPTNSNSN